MTAPPADDDEAAVTAYLLELANGPLTRAADRITELLREASETDPESPEG